MAPPITARRIVELLREWNIPYKAIDPTWATHNRNHKGPWGEVHGIMWHHTGSDEQAGMPSILWSGYEGLPGPLCHGGIDRNGVVLLSGWGRCNHAGKGDSSVLRHVRNEDYTGNLKPRDDDADGNRVFYGFEFMYSGSHEMTSAQMHTGARLSAAICTEHGWTEKSAIGHGEWQPGKWDPGMSKDTIYDMARVIRPRIAAEIKYGPKGKPQLPTRPKPTARSYTVKNGDTPWSIAKEHLGDGNRWMELVRLNPSIVLLSAGEVLKLPKE